MNEIPQRDEQLIVKLGVKSDPIIYRYSFEWLFNLMAEEGVYNLQLGTFFELYFLSDEYFMRLREAAEKRKVKISSVFSSHRELGGFMSENEEYTQVTVNNYKRLIQIAEIVGSSSAGSSMGGVLRDRMRYRDRGIEAYIEGIQELMHYAEEHGIGWLTTELMSSFAEPPCSAEEMTEIGSRLSHYHERHPDRTSRYGFCADISHGWVNENMEELQNNEDYFHAAAPYLYEFHFKNTDRIYHETFGFERENLKKGIVDVRKIRSILFQNQDKIPVNPIVGYLELPGPKLGRDYSDIQLDRMLRESLRHIKKEFFQK